MVSTFVFYQAELPLPLCSRMREGSGLSCMLPSAAALFASVPLAWCHVQARLSGCCRHLRRGGPATVAAALRGAGDILPHRPDRDHHGRHLHPRCQEPERRLRKRGQPAGSLPRQVRQGHRRLPGSSGEPPPLPAAQGRSAAPCAVCQSSPGLLVCWAARISCLEPERSPQKLCLF
jgi:hypothetical protein